MKRLLAAIAASCLIALPSAVVVVDHASAESPKTAAVCVNDTLEYPLVHLGDTVAHVEDDIFDGYTGNLVLEPWPINAQYDEKSKVYGTCGGPNDFIWIDYDRNRTNPNGWRVAHKSHQNQCACKG